MHFETNLERLRRRGEAHFIETGHLVLRTSVPRQAFLELLQELKDDSIFYRVIEEGDNRNRAEIRFEYINVFAEDA